MAVRQRKKVWYYDFSIGNRRYRDSIPEARTRAQALQAETRARQDVFDGKYNGFTKGHDFSSFVEETFLPWSRLNKRSWNDDRLIARTLCDFFRGKTFDQITPMLVEKFKKQRRESVTKLKTFRKPATVNRELCVLSKIFTLAVDAGIVQANPCHRVRKLRQDNARTRYLSRDEEDRLFGALEGRPILRDVVTVALNTGMRRGEILSLPWSNVDFSRRVINVKNTKTNRDRVIPMNDSVIRALEGIQAAGASCEYVFKSNRTRRNLRWIKRAWMAALVEAEIDDFRFHDLRHTAGTRMADAGADAYTIAAILGITIQMSARYTHATSERTRLAVEGLVYAENPGHKSVTNEERQILRPAVSR